jgi:NAD(P)-dependent dehydrogenase (short-subunit alcohol dehydrogenase family)
VDFVTLPGLEAGRSALVTGGTGAIGHAVIESLVSYGMGVGIIGRSAERLAQVTTDLGTELVLPLPCDVADTDAVGAAVDAMVGRFGSIDVLIHCAALSEGAVPLIDLTDQQIDEVIRVNVRGSIVLTRAVAPVMIRQGRGRIVNVASVAAHQAMPGRNVYGTVKAALVHLTRQLAVELGPHGITANSVSPGQTPSYITLVDDTPGGLPRNKAIAEGEADLDRIPLRKRGELRDYVGPILFFASDLCTYTTGVDMLVDGGASVLR